MAMIASTDRSAATFKCDLWRRPVAHLIGAVVSEMRHLEEMIMEGLIFPAGFETGCEPVWPSGKAGKAEGPRFESASALLSLQRRLWFVVTVL